MERQETKPMVLARIPAVGPAAPEDGTDKATPVSTGRLIGQTLSFQLLAATAMLLLAVAIIPFSWRKKDTSADSAATASASPPWQPVPLGPASDAVAGQPATPASAETPLMSCWPNPDHPTAAQLDAEVEGPRAGVNRPMAIRPPQYEADARAGRPGAGLGGAQFEGTIQKPVTRKSHYRTRPSFH